MRHGRAGEDLRGAGDAAQPRREVERPAAVAALDGHRLAGVQADPDRERKCRVRDGLVDEPSLELDRGADRLASRIEDREGFVSAQLDDGSASGLDRLARDHGELAGQRRRRLVAPLLGEHRVAADVRDQECPDVGVVAARATPGRQILLGHGGLWAKDVLRS